MNLSKFPCLFKCQSDKQAFAGVIPRSSCSSREHAENWTCDIAVECKKYIHYEQITIGEGKEHIDMDM